MTKFTVPTFQYGQHVRIKPLDGIEGRVIDLHYQGRIESVEYEVRYIHEMKSMTLRVFEDELEPVLPN